MLENKNKAMLENIKKQLEEEINDDALTFVNDYYLESSSYLCDAFSEYADGNCDIYYADQFSYYEENAADCEAALLSLYNGDDIATLIKNEGLYNLCCHAATCCQYEKTLNNLYSCEEEIKQLLVINYLLEEEIYIFNEKQLKEMLDDVLSSRINRINDIKDILDSYLEDIK